MTSDRKKNKELEEIFGSMKSNIDRFDERAVVIPRGSPDNRCQEDPLQDNIIILYGCVFRQTIHSIAEEYHLTGLLDVIRRRSFTTTVNIQINFHQYRGSKPPGRGLHECPSDKVIRLLTLSKAL